MMPAHTCNKNKRIFDRARRVLGNNIQLFYACLGNSQNYCPKVPWTARCTIARGRKVHVPRGSIFVYSAKQPRNNCFITQPMLKIPALLPRNASLIGTRRWYTQLTSWHSTSFSWHSTSFSWCLTSSTRQKTKLLPDAFPLRLIGWPHKRDIVDSMDRLVTSYERRYMYKAAARAN